MVIALNALLAQINSPNSSEQISQLQKKLEEERSQILVLKQKQSQLEYEKLTLFQDLENK